MKAPNANGTHAGIGFFPGWVFCRSRASACAIARITKRAEAVHQVEPGGRTLADQQQDDAEHRLDAGHDLGHRQPGPVPVTRAATSDPGAEAPDPAHGEHADHQEPHDLVHIGHGRILRGVGTRVARGAVAAVLVQPAREVQPFHRELHGAGRDAGALFLDPQPIEQLRQSGQVAEVASRSLGRA